MLRRKKSLGDRVRDLTPVLVLIGLGAASVVAGMNILATVAPVAIGNEPTPTPTAKGPTFAPVPSYNVATDAPVVSQYPTAPLPSGPPEVGAKQIAEKDPAGAWDVSLSYPAFAIGTTPWAADVNQAIVDMERAQADLFEEGPAAVPQAGKVNHLIGTYSTELLTPQLASFTMTWSDDTAPGRLALTVASVDLDLSTGQPIAFDDMFTDPNAALQIISTRASDLLYYQLGVSWNPNLAAVGLIPNHADFANWALTREGLKITFNEYQVVYTAQTPSVVVPWSDLMPVLASIGPVAEFTGASGSTSSPAAHSSAGPNASPSSGPNSAPGTSPSPSPYPNPTPTPTPAPID